MPTDNTGNTPSSQLGDGIHWGGEVLSREQIAQVAYQAGFRGEALVDMVGIAFRESGGAAQLYVNRPSTGDWSYGLWGLNVGENNSLWSEYEAMGFSSPDELRTPLGNARAAYGLYERYGLYPWGGYKGMPGTYSTDLDTARAAVNNAAAEGLLGTNWSDGTADVAGLSVSAPAGNSLGDDVVPRAAASAEDLRLQTFLDAALAQRGDVYDFAKANAFDGTDANLLDSDPEYFDCSELVQWAAARAGVDFVDGSWIQYQVAANAGNEMTVDEALRTPGALLFKFSSDPMQAGRPERAHVAISLGDGQVMEAASPTRGVNVFDAADRGWTHAATIPGIGTTLPIVETVSLEPIPYERDSDMDGLRDQLELFIGTDPFGVDTDRDGFADVDELVLFDSDPLDFVSSPLGSDRPDPGWRPPLTNSEGLSDAPVPAPRLTTPPATPLTPSPADDGQSADVPVGDGAADVPVGDGSGEAPNGTVSDGTALQETPAGGAGAETADVGRAATPPVDDRAAELRQFVADRFESGSGSPGGEGAELDNEPANSAFINSVTDRFGLDAAHLDPHEIARFIAPDHADYESLKVDYPALPDTWDEFADEMLGD